jgi:hypothetical protein
MICAVWIACAGCSAKKAAPTPAPTTPSPAPGDATAGETAAAPEDARPAPEPLLAPELATRLPEDGLMLATSEDGLKIYRLDRDGLHLLQRAPAAIQMLWADASTLVALNGGTVEDRDVTIRTFVVGSEPTTTKIANDGGPGPDEHLPEAMLVPGREGEVWLKRCMDTEVKRVDKNNVILCERTVYRRVHPPSTEPDTTTPPAKPAAKPPVVKQPAGIKLKRTVVKLENESGKTDKHEVFECTSSSGTATIPPPAKEPVFEVYKARSVRWLREKPPIYEVTGTLRSLMGETSSVAQVFVGCSPAGLSGYRDVGDGIWVGGEIIEENRPDGSLAIRGIWHVYVDETEIARVAGTDLSMP